MRFLNPSGRRIYDYAAATPFYPEATMKSVPIRLVIAATLVFLVACAEHATSPAAARRAATTSLRAATDAVGASDAVPASVNWEATAASLVASRSISPIAAARAYGLLGIAQYGAAVEASPSGDVDDADASNASPRAHFYEMRGAVAGASAQVLSYLFPFDVARIESQVATEGSAGSLGMQQQFAAGLAIGRRLGDVVVARGRADGFANADGTPKVWDPSTLPVGPNIWHMDPDATPHVPAGFQFPTMRPYYLTTNDQFRPPPPPADLTAGASAVAAVVNARTPEQAAIAVFWALPAGTITAIGYWDQLTAGYIAQYGLDERQAAHVFALVNSAASDATIACWEAKYTYLELRPWMVDPTDLTHDKLIIGRPNHPSYPSGHSCASSAVATVLESFFPAESATLAQEVAQAGMSRIYGGIHYFFDISAGQALGSAVAHWAINYDQTRGLLSAVF